MSSRCRSRGRRRGRAGSSRASRGSCASPPPTPGAVRSRSRAATARRSAALVRCWTRRSWPGSPGQRSRPSSAGSRSGSKMRRPPRWRYRWPASAVPSCRRPPGSAMDAALGGRGRMPTGPVGLPESAGQGLGHRRSLRGPPEDVLEDPVELDGQRVWAAPSEQGGCHRPGERDTDGHGRTEGDQDDDDDQHVQRLSHTPILPGRPREENRETPRARLTDPTDRPPLGPRRPRPIRVAVVEDHALVREGSVQLLCQEPDIEVVAEAGSGEDALPLVEVSRPDVVLVDMNLPGMSGLQFTREIGSRGLGSRVLVVSAYDDYAYVTGALEAGVGGYLLKTASARELVDALRAVADGVVVLDAGISARLARRWRADARMPERS